MSSCRTLYCNKRLLKLDGKLFISRFQSVRKILHLRGNSFVQKELSVFPYRYRAVSNLFTFTRYYWFGCSSKTFNKLNLNFFHKKWYDKHASTLGSINKEDVPLTKSQADDLILRLTEDERKALLTALQEYNSNQVKAEYEGIRFVFDLYF